MSQEKYYEKNIFVIFVDSIKDEYKQLIFGDICIYKVKFHDQKSPVLFYL